MSDDVIRVPARSLKEQFSRSSGAWKEQSDPIFRFWAEGDWWGFPFFSLNAVIPTLSPFYQRALAIRETALGPEHPDMALR
jgi:hypothetical protein